MFARHLILIALASALVPAFANPNSASTPAPSGRADFFRAQPSKAGEFRGAWIHSGYGIQGWDWDQTVGALKSNGFNAIFPNLVWAGLAHYPSTILPISPRVEDQGDQIATCLSACRKYGVELHVWKVNYYLLHAPREFVAELRVAGRTQRNTKGEDVNWLCPSHPENVALERDSMLEVARQYDVDGIHFDYLRYPDREACFCTGCRERFEAAANVKLANWPEDVLQGERAEPFAEWRREQITRLVRTVSQEARALKPNLKVSAAVWGGWANARQSIGQDAQAWIDAGYLDFVCPMNYESEDEVFAGWTRKQVDAINRRTPLYIGIGAYKLSGPEQLTRQIQLSRELGGDGFVVFQLNEKLATEFLPLLRLGTTAAPPASKN
ncbi:MAG: family 10 glycosylhydrolase [Verrucomicrobiae bacterium]|nr:family 10 glycosylhydrolase [Verrucomicrobiae bacterium]